MDKKIHQLWINENVPQIPNMYEVKWREEWRKEYEGCYKLWYTEDIKELINDHFVWIKDEFWSWPANYQADISRLLILYVHGGAYIDLDCIFVKRFDHLFNNSKAKGVPNHFLIFQKGDSLLKTIINELYNNILRNKIKNKICKTCGPVAFNEVLKKHEGEFETLSSESYNNLGKHYKRVSEKRVNNLKNSSDHDVYIIHQYLKGWSLKTKL